PAGIEELDRLVALEDGERVVFDLTNARGVLGFSLYELARRYEGGAPERCPVGRVDWSARTIRSVSPDGLDLEPPHTTLRLADDRGVHGRELLGLERSPGSRSPFGQAAYRLASSIPQARPLLEAAHRGGPDRPLRIQGKRALPLVEELVEDGVLEWRGST